MLQGLSFRTLGSSGLVEGFRIVGLGACRDVLGYGVPGSMPRLCLKRPGRVGWAIINPTFRGLSGQALMFDEARSAEIAVLMEAQTPKPNLR